MGIAKGRIPDMLADACFDMLLRIKPEIAEKAAGLLFGQRFISRMTADRHDAALLSPELLYRIANTVFLLIPIERTGAENPGLEFLKVTRVKCHDSSSFLPDQLAFLFRDCLDFGAITWLSVSTHRKGSSSFSWEAIPS